MFEFTSGLITMGFLIAGLFFIRYYNRTGDLLFAAFAVAFWLLAANQFLLVFANIRVEERSLLFLLRLAAFGLIIAAIIRKNRRGRDGPP